MISKHSSVDRRVGTLGAGEDDASSALCRTHCTTPPPRKAFPRAGPDAPFVRRAPSSEPGGIGNSVAGCSKFVYMHCWRGPLRRSKWRGPVDVELVSGACKCAARRVSRNRHAQLLRNQRDVSRVALPHDFRKLEPRCPSSQGLGTLLGYGFPHCSDIALRVCQAAAKLHGRIGHMTVTRHEEANMARRQMPIQPRQ